MCVGNVETTPNNYITNKSRYQTLARKDSYNAVAGGNDIHKKHRCEADKSQFMWKPIEKHLLECQMTVSRTKHLQGNLIEKGVNNWLVEIKCTILVESEATAERKN